MTTAAVDRPRAPVRTRSLFASPDFRQLFAADAASKLGTQVSYIALPLLAVTVLRATPGQVGLLRALAMVAFLVIGLPAGAWVDRVRRRGVLVGADLARAVLFGSLPVAWWLDLLTMAQLYVVVLLAGAATVFFDVAAQSYLPHVVGRGQLTDANGKLVGLATGTEISGLAAGGYLVQLLAAPVAVLVDAVSYAVSAVFLLRVRRPEPLPAAAARAPLRREVGAGLRFVFGHPVLRSFAIAYSLGNVVCSAFLTMVPVLFVRELGLSGGALGMFLAAGGVGGLAGALSARRLGTRLGDGWALWLTAVAAAPLGLLLPLLDHGIGLWLAGAGWVATTFRIGVGNVLQVSLRQQLTPDPMLGRMNATMRFLLTGAVAVGAAAAGVLAELAGVRSVLWLVGIGLAVWWIPLSRRALLVRGTDEEEVVPC